MKSRPRVNLKTVSSPDDTIHGAGLRMTEQRRAVFDTLIAQRDHPTAVDLFTRVRNKIPGISLATVYNCLDTLSACHLVKTVQIDRGPARYCPNLDEHAHFHCESCGKVIDLPLRSRKHPQDVWDLPEDLSITGHEVAFRGVCPDCARDGKASKSSSNS